MRTSFVIALMTWACLSLDAQDPTWIKHYGNVGYNDGFNLVSDGATGFYGVGTIGAPGYDLDGQTTSILGDQDILLVKWDSSGTAIWAKTAGGYCTPSDKDYGRHIAYDPASQHVIISGRYDCPFTFFDSLVINGSLDDRPDMFLAAYDAGGVCLWTNGVRGTMSSSQILTDQSSSIYVFGGNDGSVVFPGPVPATVLGGGFCAKYSADGELISAERILSNGSIFGASWVSSNEWVVAGYASASAQFQGQPIEVGSPSNDGFVARTSTLGSVAWITQFRSSVRSQIWDCATTIDGHIYASGYFIDSLYLADDTLIGPSGVISFFIASLSSSGTVEWVTPLISPTQIFVTDLKAGPNGDIHIMGYFMNELTLGTQTLNSANTINGFVASFDPDGSCKGALRYGRVYHGGGSVLPLTDGLLISSDYDSTMVIGSEVIPVSQIGAPDLFIAKFDSLSGFTSVQSMGVEPGSLHIYANPNNGLCTIELPTTIQPGSDLVLTLFDTQGRVVEQAPLLYHDGTVQLDIQAQAKGVYMVELQDGQQRYSGTIVFE